MSSLTNKEICDTFTTKSDPRRPKQILIMMTNCLTYVSSNEKEENEEDVVVMKMGAKPVQAISYS